MKFLAIVAFAVILAINLSPTEAVTFSGDAQARKSEAHGLFDKVVDEVLDILGHFIAGTDALGDIDALSNVFADVRDFYTAFAGEISSGTVDGVDVRGYINDESEIFNEAFLGTNAFEAAFAGITSSPSIENSKNLLSQGRKALKKYQNAKTKIVNSAITQIGVVDALEYHIEALEGVENYFITVIARIPGPDTELPKSFLAALDGLITKCVATTRAALPAN